MIIQLHGFPINANGVSRGAENNDEYQIVVREIRWILLNESDWIMIPDSPATQEQRTEWATWRQYLRDLPPSIPSTLGDTLEITDPPTALRPPTWVNVTPDADWAKDHLHDHSH